MNFLLLSGSTRQSYSWADLSLRDGTDNWTRCRRTDVWEALIRLCLQSSGGSVGSRAGWLNRPWKAGCPDQTFEALQKPCWSYWMFSSLKANQIW